MRFFTPALLLGAAFTLHLYNPTETGEVLLFPFVDVLVPSTEGDRMAQAEVSEQILWGAGALSLVLSLWRWRKEHEAQ
ncbi:MAG: hypothetical protein VXW32_02705 [Myxococcota bacterium]|nr:hypothetical protein [Myxococcota bacterium]